MIAPVNWQHAHGPAAPGDIGCFAYVVAEDGKFVPVYGQPGKPLVCFPENPYPADPRLADLHRRLTRGTETSPTPVGDVLDSGRAARDLAGLCWRIISMRGGRPAGCQSGRSARPVTSCTGRSRSTSSWRLVVT